MDKKAIVKQLQAEIDRLERAIDALDEQEEPTRPTVIPDRKNPKQRNYIMNPETRNRLAEAQKKRWEKQREEKAKQERAASAKFKEGLSSRKPRTSSVTNKKSPTT